MLSETQSIFTQALDLGNKADQTNPNSSLGKEDFLNLLVTQMQYQDPLDPMKNEQFVAQMAQFSQLEQMINLNDTAEAIRLLDTSINNSQAVNLIGKNITVQGSAFEISEGTATDFSYSLGDDASEVEISIFDESGAIVRTVTEFEKSSGNHNFQFDGNDDYGDLLPDGNYRFSVSAVNAEGDPIPANTYSSLLVDGITFDNGTLYLSAAGSHFRLSDIVEVKQ